MSLIREEWAEGTEDFHFSEIRHTFNKVKNYTKSFLYLGSIRVGDKTPNNAVSEVGSNWIIMQFGIESTMCDPKENNNRLDHNIWIWVVWAWRHPSHVGSTSLFLRAWLKGTHSFIKGSLKKIISGGRGRWAISYQETRNWSNCVLPSLQLELQSCCAFLPNDSIPSPSTIICGDIPGTVRSWYHNQASMPGTLVVCLPQISVLSAGHKYMETLQELPFVVSKPIMEEGGFSHLI